MTDPYEILGVEKTATDDEIKKAYRRLAMKWHPDRNRGNEEAAAEEFKKCTKAFEQIETQEKRDSYKPNSSSTRYTYRKNPSWAEDAFEEMFRRKYNEAEHQHSRSYSWDDIKDKDKGKWDDYEDDSDDYWVRNTDLTMSHTITLEEAFTGVEKVINFTHNGKHRTVILNIPGGIEHEKVIRCVGGGSIDNPHRTAGDLLVTVRIATHPKFVREAQNIIWKYSISALELIGGTVVRVKTIDGQEYDVTIRPCTKPTTKIRIPNQGMKVMNSTLRGDMFIEFDVVWPTNLSEEHIAVIQKLY